jgi:predicted phosphodiesterase
MRLAVLSDIHGNLLALETALADLENQGAVDLIWCLGDLAAFGPRPAECIRLLRERRESFGKEKFHIIGGNTDRWLVTGERGKQVAPDEETFKTLAQMWNDRDSGLNWGVGQLSYDDYQFLQKRIGREVSHEFEGYGRAIGYHAIPGDDEALLTPETPDHETLDMLLDREGRLAIGGHIHRQMDRDIGRWRVVNVGSVGMSFDNPGFAQWGLLTCENGALTLDLRNVPYDVQAVIDDLYAIGYPAPEWMGKRLRRP